MLLSLANLLQKTSKPITNGDYISLTILFTISAYTIYVIYFSEVHQYMDKRSYFKWVSGSLASLVLLFGIIPTKNILLLLLLTLAAIIDIEYKEVPNIIPIILMVIALTGPMDSVNLVISSGIAVILLPICMLGRVGAGDYKIFVAVSFLMGWEFILLNLISLSVIVLTMAIPLTIKEGYQCTSNQTKETPLMGFYLFSVLITMLTGVFN